MLVAKLLQDAVTITVFVAVMMIAIEYLNVRTRGLLLRALGESPWRQYFLAVILGVTPGCLGAFALVALYSHRRLSPGALVAGMITTSGDEMFVMLALIPKTALVMTAGLMALGLAGGWITDRVLRIRPSFLGDRCVDFDLHGTEHCRCFSMEDVLEAWHHPSLNRSTLSLCIAVILIAITAGWIGPSAWAWKRVLLLIVTGFAFAGVVTVPDHFLDEHLWRHISRKHVPRIFLWTLGAVAAMSFLEGIVDVRSLVSENRWVVLLVAVIVGIIPESGPHLLFVTLFAQGVVPYSVLVGSSAVEDGHGMLPLLAHSRQDFFRIKALSFLIGTAAGTSLMALGF